MFKTAEDVGKGVLESIYLGPLKSNPGDQNYVLPTRLR
jgi:hypothetical protein